MAGGGRNPAKVKEEFVMTICPVAIAVGCKKCPVFKICPVKSIIGDYKPDAEATQPLPPVKKARKKARK